MKTFKILFAAVIFAGFATSAVADDPSQTIDARATILTFITIEDTQAVNFGAISADLEDNPTLDPLSENPGNDNTGLGDTSGDVQLGIFTISGGNDASISITLPGDVTLVNTEDASQSLNFSPSFGWAQGDDAQFGADALTGALETTLDADGKGRVFVGGEITNLDDQIAGLYENTADVTISVVYN